MTLLAKLRRLKHDRETPPDHQQTLALLMQRWGELRTQLLDWSDPLVQEGLLLAGGTVQNDLLLDVPVPGGTLRLSFRPHADPVPGAVGRVQVRLNGRPAYVLLLLEDQSWELVARESGQVLRRTFAAHDVGVILERLLLEPAFETATPRETHYGPL